jgi:DNA-binding NarL/FixJ family response regulator
MIVNKDLNGGQLGAVSRAGPADRITVALADDHPALRIGTKQVLEHAGMAIVVEIGRGDDLTATLAAHSPCVLMLDTRFQDQDALKKIPRITKLCPASRVLVYSSRSEPSLARTALNAGAVGFVAKSSDIEQLVVAVRAVAAGERYVQPDVAAGLFGRNRSNAVVSERERHALQLWAAGHTNRDVAKALKVSLRTIESVRADLRCRLALSTRSSITRYVMEQM